MTSDFMLRHYFKSFVCLFQLTIIFYLIQRLRFNYIIFMGQVVLQILAFLSVVLICLQWRRQPKKSGGSEQLYFAGEQ